MIFLTIQQNHIVWGGVKDVTNKAEYFEILIFDRRLFRAKDFEYVRCVETGKYYINNGKWVDTEMTDEQIIKALW